MFGLGVQELVIILAIAMLFFGGKKIPEIAKGLGKGIREFKTASEKVTDDVTDAIEGGGGEESKKVESQDVVTSRTADQRDREAPQGSAVESLRLAVPNPG